MPLNACTSPEAEPTIVPVSILTGAVKAAPGMVPSVEVIAVVGARSLVAAGAVAVGMSWAGAGCGARTLHAANTRARLAITLLSPYKRFIGLFMYSSQCLNSIQL